jgi:hypothetical protein
LWDVESGAKAWRPFEFTPYKHEVISPGSFKAGPGEKQTHFAAMTNSVVLASGRAREFSGIRLKLDGGGKEGKLSVRLCRDSRSTQEVAYKTNIDYPASKIAVDLPWSAFKGPDEEPKLPDWFDGLVLEGDRADGSTITIETIDLYISPR